MSFSISSSQTLKSLQNPLVLGLINVEVKKKNKCYLPATNNGLAGVQIIHINIL